MKIINKNKKAFFDYEIIDKIEAGVVLTGDEVKSLRAGHLSLNGAFATFHGGELFMINATIAAYHNAYLKKDDQETRTRKLLLNKKELMRLIGDVSRKGITLIPLCMYFNSRGKVKVEIGLCKHKSKINKKQELKEKDIKREAEKEIRGKF